MQGDDGEDQVQRQQDGSVRKINSTDTGKSTQPMAVSGSCSIRADGRRQQVPPFDGSGIVQHGGRCSTRGEYNAGAIKKAVRLLGGDEKQYSTHSLRSGGATALFEAGCDDTTIKQHGRWASDCFQRYIHAETVSMKRLSDQMAGNASGFKLQRSSTEVSPHGGAG